MNKIAILQVIARRLESDLEQATDAAIESAESATHEESRAEGKYDTRGLETTYLASGQARHAVEEFFVISASPFQRPVMGLYHLITPLEKGSSRVAVVKVSLESVDSSE